MNKKLNILKTFAVIVLVTLSHGFVKAQPINDMQKESFRKEVQKLLKTYSDASTFTSNEINFDLAMANTLRGTFIETQKPIVFNDLLPTKTEGDKYLTPIGYTQFAQRFYSEGLDVKLNIEDISFESLPVKGTYTAIVRVNKKIRGFYSNKKIHSFTGTLYYFVQATITGTNVEKIGISLVADPEKYAQFQSNKNFGGLYAGISGIYNQSMLLNNTIISNTTWETSLGSGISPSIDVYYMITKGFGIGTGLRFGSYSSMMSIKNFNKQLSSTVTDVDGDEYYPIFNISQLEELNSYKTIDIPLSLKFRGGKGKTGMYFDLGVIYSMFRNASYTLNGEATTMGYYDQFNVTLSNIPDYDFETTEYNSATFDMSVPDKNLSAFVSTGLTFVVYPDIAMRVGINALYGLTDLMYNESRHRVDFYATTGLNGDKTNLLSMGVEIGVCYRILSGTK